MTETGRSYSVKVDAVGGLCAGVVGTVIGFPLDLIKTRIQTAGGKFLSSSSSPGLRLPAGTQRNGILQIGFDVVRHEGLKSLYRGMTPSLISLTILNTLNFSSYSYFRSTWLDAQRGWDYRNACAGMLGGPLAGSISTVELLVKTQLQLDNVSEKRFRGSWHCLTTLVKERGYTVLYTGHGVNVAREAVFLGTYFFTYEGVKEYLCHQAHWNVSLSVPVAGGISGALGWFMSFPFDCIRAGIQGRPIKMDRLGAMTVANDLYKRKGFRGLYAGVKPSIIRAFLVSASRFSTYEVVVWLFKWTGYSRVN